MVQSNRRRFPKQTFLIKIHQINLKKKFQPPSIDNTFKGFFIDFHFLSIDISIYPTSKCPLTSSQPATPHNFLFVASLFVFSTPPLSLFHFHFSTLTLSFPLSHSHSFISTLPLNSSSSHRQSYFQPNQLPLPTVILLCASADSIRKIMLRAYDLGYCNGEYVFIYIDLFAR